MATTDQGGHATGPGTQGCPSDASKRSRVLVVAVVVWLTIGGNYLGFRVGVETVPPFLLTASRLLLGALFVVPLAVLAGARSADGRRWPTRKQLRSTAVMAILLLVIGQGALVWGVQKLPAGTSAILTSSVPIWVALLALAFVRTPLPRRSLLGILLGFAGLACLALVRDGGAGGGIDLLAAGVTLAGSIAAATAILYGGRADLPKNDFLGVALQMVIAAAVSFVVSVAAGETTGLRLDAISSRSWWALAYLIVLGTASSVGLLWLTRNAAPATASSFAYAGPVVALGLSAWLLGETLGPAKLAAAAFALGGVSLMVSDNGRRRAGP